MERQKVQSSNVAAIGHEAGVMEVEFHGTNCKQKCDPEKHQSYRYEGITPEEHQRFMESGSKGQFFHKTFKQKKFKLIAREKKEDAGGGLF